MTRRLRSFLVFFAAVAALAGTLGLSLYSREARARRQLTETREHQVVESLSRSLALQLDSVVADLSILSSQAAIDLLLDADTPADERRRAGDEVADGFLLYVANRGVYDQLRVLDTTGQEIVRVNYQDGFPKRVPNQWLQSKADRDYFQAATQLRAGEVFMSPLDLNVEGSEIERPFKPMIRFATALFDQTGERRGILLANYLGGKVIDEVERAGASSAGDLMLLNRSGYFLRGPRPEDAWGFMVDERSDQSFGHRFPDAWQRVSGSERGLFLDATGLFTYKRLDPLSGRASSSVSVAPGAPPGAVRWTIVSRVSPEAVSPASTRSLATLLGLYAVLLGSIAVGTWLLLLEIAQRRRAEHGLRQAELKTKAIVRSVGEGIISIDESSVIRFTNPELCSMFDYEEASLLGSTLSILIPEPLRGRHALGMRRALQGGGQPLDGRRLEADGRRRDGERFPIEIRIVEVELEEGRWFTATVRPRASGDDHARAGAHDEQRAVAHAQDLLGDGAEPPA